MTQDTARSSVVTAEDFGHRLQEIAQRCRRLNASALRVKLSGTALTEDLRGSFKLCKGVLELKLELTPQDQEDEQRKEDEERDVAPRRPKGRKLQPPRNRG